MEDLALEELARNEVRLVPQSPRSGPFCSISDHVWALKGGGLRAISTARSSRVSDSASRLG